MKYLILASLVFFNLISCSSSKSIPSSAQTETFKVWGNCGMCKKNIEGALQTKGIYKADWNKDTKLITVSFDSTTNIDAIQQKIASVGYDTEKYSGDDNAYKQLPQCCKYDRKPIDNNELKTQTTTTQTSQTTTVVTSPIVNNNKPAPAKTTASTPTATPSTTSTQTSSSTTTTVIQTQTYDLKSKIAAILNAYYTVKDALVATDGNTANQKAANLLSVLNDLDITKLPAEQQKTITSLLDNIKSDTKIISQTKNVAKQRDHFNTLSNNLWQLVKTNNANPQPAYQQYCPMKKTYWISDKDVVENPYYGDEMLNCGKVTEILK